MRKTSKIHKKGKGNHGILLSPQELEKLLKLVSVFPTKTEAAVSIGLDRNVLERVLNTQRGSFTTVNKIQNFINGQPTNSTPSR